jgi:predicted anti-sigma-YlaC factor YlaD
MTRNEHERAQRLIALAGAESASDQQQTWLRSHLQECPTCREYQEAATRVVSALRSQPLAADSSLVRATQIRVRSRALELQRQQERLWVVCVCCAAVTLSTAFTTAILWGGFAWMGQQARLSALAWPIGMAALGWLPAIVTGILLLARGTYLADHDGSFQDRVGEE